MTPVVILNMHYSGLAIARDLAGRGIPVFGLSADRSLPGNRTRYARFLECPDSLEHPAELATFLIELSRKAGERPLIFPTRDHDILFVNAHRDQLGGSFRIPFPDEAGIEPLLNKDSCAAAARDVGIRTPRSRTVATGSELRDVTSDLVFPVIAKPLMASRWRRPGIWEVVRKQKAIICRDWQELSDLYGTVATWDPQLTVQEFVPGPEENLCIFGSHVALSGEMTGYFTARKRLQFPRLRGTGIVVEGRPIPSVVEPSRQLLKRLDFFGISEIEYKIHEITGEPYLIEINPRHWDQHGLGTACGVNLSWLAYQDWAASPPSAAGERWPRSADGPRQKPTTVSWIAETEFLLECARLVAAGDGGLRGLLRLVGGERTYAVLSWRDPGPVISLTRGLARTFWRRTRARFVRGRAGVVPRNFA